MITGDTDLARLLDARPGLLDSLAVAHPPLAHLRDTLRHRPKAPRVTVAQAARIAGMDAGDLVATLRRLAGEADDGAPAVPPAAEPGGPTAMPAELAGLAEADRVRLDVREDIRSGQEPFARIMAAVKTLPVGAALVLRAPFEPVPLYDVLGRRGFAHWTERGEAGDWTVWFHRGSAAAPDRPAAAAPTGPALVRLDVRGLEPPQPMVQILTALEHLGPGQVLEVLHARRPMFLYPQLDDRGFAHETDEPAPGLVRIVIRREGPR